MLNKISKNKVIYNTLLILSFCFIAVVSLSLFMNTRVLFGHADLAFHFRRVIELKDCIIHHSFLPTYSFNQYHGSLVMTLYPYITLIPLAFLLIFIKSYIIVVYIWYILSIFLSLVTSYYCSYSLKHSAKLSYVFSLIYSMSIVFMGNGFDDFGELASFIVLPMVVFGTLEFIKYNKYIEMTIGLSLIVFSHVLTSFIAISLVIILLIVNFHKLNRQKFMNLLKAFILLVLITSIVWVPVLKFKLFNNTNVFVPTSSRYVVGYNIILLIIKGLLNIVTVNQLGLIPVFCIFISPFVYAYFNLYVKQMFWISICIVLFISNLFPWHFMPKFVLNIFGIFQSPSRFIIIPWILLSYVFAFIITKCLTSSFVNNFIVISLFIYSLLLFMIYKFNIINAILYRKNYLKNHIILISLILITGVLTIIILISLLSILMDRYSKWDVSIIQGVGIFLSIILIQFGGQLESINSYSKAPIITNQFIHTGIKHNRNLVNVFNKYKVSNSKQFKNLLSFKASPIDDYYPKASVIKSRLINNNEGYANSHHVFVHHCGFNKFKFNLHSRIHSLSLPLLYYNKENIKLYLNNHNINYSSNRYNMIKIFNINKGHNQLYVKYEPNIYFDIIRKSMFIIGIIWIVFACYIDGIKRRFKYL